MRASADIIAIAVSIKADRKEQVKFMDKNMKMEKFISKEKLSKKARQEMNNAQRKTWLIAPITRKVESKKRYKRNKAAVRDSIREDF